MDEVLVQEQSIVPEVAQNEVATRQAQALAVLAESFKTLTTFITGGGLNQLLQGNAKSQAVTAIVGGLAAHDGRGSLDARVLGQNALEIAKFIEKCHDEYARILTEKRDPDIREVVEEMPTTKYFKDGVEIGAEDK